MTQKDAREGGGSLGKYRHCRRERWRHSDGLDTTLLKRVHEAATAHKSRPRSSQPKTASHTSFGSSTLVVSTVPPITFLFASFRVRALPHCKK